ncbi:MAG TPA: hypothetical protein VLR44_10520 [Rhodoferax sp.]|nr:hypothetical protein [Rhodoferax sp.]
MRTATNLLHKVIATAMLALLSASPAMAQTQLKPGPIEGISLHVPNQRGHAWCEAIPIIGEGATATAEVYNSTGFENCTAERSAHLDPKKLAAELNVGLVALNLKRFWAADEIFFYQAGETISFQGVKAIWVASMNAEKLKAGLTGNFFTDTLIKRDTNWLYKKGKPVYLLRAPGNKVWVLQVYGHQVDPTLSMETMDQLGSKLKLPEGWKFETKILDQDLAIEPRKAGGVAHILRDNLTNTYQACGYDDACSFLP